jgi:hypothetical protein
MSYKKPLSPPPLLHDNKKPYWEEPKVEKELPQYETELVSLNMKRFNEHTSRDGTYQFYKIFLEDKERGKVYCVKANKSFLYKLILDTLNCEEFKNEFRSPD